MKKIIGTILALALFSSGVICGDLFNNYIPFEGIVFEKKEEVKSEEPKDNKEENKEEETDIDKKAEEILASMTLDEKIYQMMFVTPESITGIGQCVQAQEGTKEALKKYPVGGIIYFEKNVQDKEQLKTMIKNTQSFSKIPLFIGVDEEGGRVRRLGVLENLGMTYIGDMADIGRSGDTSKAYEAAKTISQEIKELGFNVDFAPVCDVLTNPENTVVKRRSFGSDASVVSAMAASFVNGLQDNNVSACLKHFPGHGGTAGDTHDGYSENPASKEEFLSGETSAFKKGIEEGVDFVMTGHISIPSITNSTVPASLSGDVIKILKEEYGFEGVVITDALNMGAISQNFSVGDSAKMAIMAGNDMILMPSDVTKAFVAIKSAIGNSITEEDINERVLRILKVKIKRGIIK